MKKGASQLNLVQEELRIIDIWGEKNISAKKAKNYFSANLTNSNFCGVWSMNSETDRVRFLRYLFTGCIFVDEDLVKSGNPTMFTQLNGLRKNIAFENFFKSVNLKSTHLSKAKKNSLFEEITFATQSKFNSKCWFLKTESLEKHISCNSSIPRCSCNHIF